jgi:hypothetical protein
MKADLLLRSSESTYYCLGTTHCDPTPIDLAKALSLPQIAITEADVNTGHQNNGVFNPSKQYVFCRKLIYLIVLTKISKFLFG